jgi:hypothetical protein
MVGTRYEGLFFVVVAVVVLLALRHVVRVAIVAVSSAVPVGIYALFSLFHKGEVLPNTLILKGVRLRHLPLGAKFLNVLRTTAYNSYEAAYLLFLLLAIGVMVVLLRKYDRRLNRTGCSRGWFRLPSLHEC